MFNDLILSASAIAILSRLQIGQLSAFFGIELLTLYSTCHLISAKLMLFKMANLDRVVV
jgi:hypothetical protein